MSAGKLLKFIEGEYAVVPISDKLALGHPIHLGLEAVNCTAPNCNMVLRIFAVRKW